MYHHFPEESANLPLCQATGVRREVDTNFYDGTLIAIKSLGVLFNVEYSSYIYFPDLL